MSFEQAISALGIMGAILGFFASSLGALGLWIVNGMRSDLHQITEKISEVLQKMITREESQQARDRLREELGERFDAIESRVERTEATLFVRTVPRK